MNKKFKQEMKELTIMKIGGSLMNKDKFPLFMRELVPYIKKNRTIIVHGGGKEITAMSEKLGLKTKFVKGRRFTDKDLLEVVEMVLTGKVNRDLVGQLNATKIPSIGFSGRDGEVVKAKRIKSLGHVGVPVKVNNSFIQNILNEGYVPVFASIASDGKGNALNVNADELTSALAVSLKAERLILFTDVPGLLDKKGKTIQQISPKEGRQLINKKVISGGMIPKIKSSFNALVKGVGEIWILKGHVPLHHSKGTLITNTQTEGKHPFHK